MKMVYPAVASARVKCHPRLIGAITESDRPAPGLASILGALHPIVGADRKQDLEAVQPPEQLPARDDADAAAVDMTRKIRSDGESKAVSVAVFHFIGLVDVEQRRDEIDARRSLRSALGPTVPLRC